MKLSVLLLLISLLLVGCVADVPQADIAIIGGADGPTAIFVAGGDSLWLFVGLLVLAAVVVLAVVLLLRGKKK